MSIIRFDDFQRFNEDLVSIQQQQALKRYIERSSQRERTVENLNSKNPIGNRYTRTNCYSKENHKPS